jgi:hypothetical protein
MASPGQTKSEAVTAASNYIQEQSCNNTAGALHAAQDLATPAHAGQEWPGFKFNSKTFWHLFGDTLPSIGTINNAYQNSKIVLNGSGYNSLKYVK